MNLLAVTETFETVQGEGLFLGTPAFFIRLAGCSVACPIRASCDTDFNARRLTTSTDLAKEAATSKAEVVVLTGGEPLEQDVVDLTKALRDAGKRLHLETSGLIAVPSKAVFDWIVVSPKAPAAKLKQDWGNEVKVVYYGQTDARLVEYEALPFAHRWLQPFWRPEEVNVAETYAVVRRLAPSWRLSIQAHKHWGLP